MAGITNTQCTWDYVGTEQLMPQAGDNGGQGVICVLQGKQKVFFASIELTKSYYESHSGGLRRPGRRLLGYNGVYCIISIHFLPQQMDFNKEDCTWQIKLD